MDFSFRRTNHSDSAIIKQIIRLADFNKKTLGFLPAGAIEEHCINGNAFVCLKGTVLVGYILFSQRKSYPMVRISHFCVDKQYRGNGVSSDLFEHFKNSISNAFYIELSCREDYGLDSFWTKLGFNLIKAKEGRAVNEVSVLHLFRYPLQQNLLDIIEAADMRPKVLLDASAVFDLELGNNGFDENNSLLVHGNEVQFYVAKVVYEDMARQSNDAVRLNTLKKVKPFKVLNLSIEKWEELEIELQEMFPNIAESDLKQLACAIANDVECFVTNDNQLLKIYQKFADSYNVIIYSPAEFYRNIDSILSREIVRTEPLPSAHGALEDMVFDEEGLVSKYLNNAQGEKRCEFVGVLREHQHRALLKQIVIAGDICGFLYYSITNGVFTVHLIRLLHRPGNYAQVVANFILSELIQRATHKGIVLIEMLDKFAPPQIVSSGRHLGFVDDNKVTIKYIGSSQAYLESAKRALPEVAFTSIQAIAAARPSNDDPYAQVALEHQFFPAKFTDIEIPTFVIPIKPSWAHDLITPEMKDEYSLMPSATGNVLMYISNAYFTGTNARVTAPGRILWYVTTNKSKHFSSKWAKHIIASSYLDEVHFGSKQDIFKKFCRIGVYGWKNINTIKADVCTAIVFSRTEIFPNKIPYNMLQTMIRNKAGKGVTPVSIFPVPKDVFFEIYEQGCIHGQA